MDDPSSLWALFASSFLAATLLPGGSEFVFAGILNAKPHLYWPALGGRHVGNTLGGMSSYLIGRVIPQRAELKGLKWVQSYGSPVLLAAWVPIHRRSAVRCSGVAAHQSMVKRIVHDDRQIRALPDDRRCHCIVVKRA